MSAVGREIGDARTPIAHVCTLDHAQRPGGEDRRLPVVVLTSSNQSLDINRAYDLGANSYLVKPAGFDSLLELVKNLDMYWLILNEKPELSGS